MRIQFLRWTDSAQPGFPFVPGQVIAVDGLTPEVRAWLTPLPDGTVRAHVLEDEPAEIATVDPSPAMATVKVKRTRRGR